VCVWASRRPCAAPLGLLTVQFVGPSCLGFWFGFPCRGLRREVTPNLFFPVNSESSHAPFLPPFSSPNHRFRPPPDYPELSSSPPPPALEADAFCLLFFFLAPPFFFWHILWRLILSNLGVWRISDCCPYPCSLFFRGPVQYYGFLLFKIQRNRPGSVHVARLTGEAVYPPPFSPLFSCMTSLKVC